MSDLEKNMYTRSGYSGNSARSTEKENRLFFWEFSHKSDAHLELAVAISVPVGRIEKEEKHGRQSSERGGKKRNLPVPPTVNQTDSERWTLDYVL